jgi:hypothetical protein
MRLAWFRPASARESTPAPDEDTVLLAQALSTRHDIEIIDARAAHDFVWRHARHPFDLCVYELGGTPAHQFANAYAVHYPGIALLRGLPRCDRALRRSRLIVVAHEPVAEALSDDYPSTRVRTLTPGVEPLPESMSPVVTALRWPPDGRALTHALAGFAAARAVIVFDGPETADWPSLDPQSWSLRAPLEHRGLSQPREPICVSIDPRDEMHSLRLALRRLEEDPALRARLGAAAQAWWREHATVELATARFERLLEEARSLPDPPVDDADDGMGLARQLLREFGVEPWAPSLEP